MSLFAIAAWSGTLICLWLAWDHRIDISILYRIWKLNRSIPDAVPIPEADPVPALTGRGDINRGTTMFILEDTPAIRALSFADKTALYNKRQDKPWPNTRAMDSREIPEPMARAALEALTEGPRLRRVK